MFKSLAELVTRRGLAVVLVWLALAVILRTFAPEWKGVTRDDDVHFFPAGYPSVVGQDLLERGFPEEVTSSSFVVIGERPDGKLTSGDLAYIDQVSDLLKALREQKPVLQERIPLEIKTITDHRTPIIGPRLIGTAPDGKGQAVLISMALGSTYESKQSRLTVEYLTAFLHDRERCPAPPVGLNVATTGSAAVGHDRQTLQMQSVAAIDRTTILLVVVILLLVYRSPLLALIPVLTIALSVVIALGVIASVTLIPGVIFQVINITDLFVKVILFGAGTDYCLFLIARYREELVRGRGRAEALRSAIEQVGGALVASAGTVIVGLGMLYFSLFAKIQYTGPAIALSLAIALAAALTMAPVLLNWFRGAVFWPFPTPHHEEGEDREREVLQQAPSLGFWTMVANAVVRRPALILTLSIAGLIPFAIVGTRSRADFNQMADLSSDQPSVVGTQIVRRYFPAGEQSPTLVVIADPKLDFRSDAGFRAIAQFTDQLSRLPNIAEVRAVSRPLGEPLPLPEAPEKAQAPASPAGGFLSGLAKLGEQLASGAGSKSIARTALRAGSDPRYVSTRPANLADRDHITRVEVVFGTDPFDEASQTSLRQVGEVALAAARPGGVLAGASVGLGGSTAMIVDLATVTAHDQKQMYVLVTLGVYVILVVLLRQPGISLYLIATVILGYLSSLGLTELVFRALHTGPEPWVGLDWRVGFFLFVILVALGEDYNIFLMSRVVEEERKHGPIEGTRLAVAHTGGIISSCGLIMAGTFLSLLAGSLTSLHQLGFALGTGVLLDTFIVRPILVPAFLVLWHRYRPHVRLHSPTLDNGDGKSENVKASSNGDHETISEAPMPAAPPKKQLVVPHGPAYMTKRWPLHSNRG